MIRKHSKHTRPGTALITAVVLLLIMATISATVLSMRTTDVCMDIDAIRAMRADAAALGALQLCAWTLQNDTDLQTALAAAHEQGEDTWLKGSKPLFQITGELSGATFTVNVWPRPDEVRLQARAVLDGVYRERWSHITVTKDKEKKAKEEPVKPKPGRRPTPAGPRKP